MGLYQDQQNILVVMADQLTARALGCYGNDEVFSPNIDTLASQGVLFKNAYSSSPLCTPARYAFMTGQNVSNVEAMTTRLTCHRRYRLSLIICV